MNYFPPNTDPFTFTITGVIISSLCTGDYNSNELNAMGNWIILIGQYLLTYAAQAQLLESRIENNNINVNSKEFKNGGSPFKNNSKSNQNQRDEVEYLLNKIQKIENELKKLKEKIE